MQGRMTSRAAGRQRRNPGSSTRSALDQLSGPSSRMNMKAGKGSVGMLLLAIIALYAPFSGFLRQAPSSNSHADLSLGGVKSSTNNNNKCPSQITVIRGGLDPPRGRSGFGSYFFVEISGMIEDEVKRNNTDFVIIPDTQHDSFFYPREGNVTENKWSRFFQPVNAHLLPCLTDNSPNPVTIVNSTYNRDIHKQVGRIKAWPHGQERQFYGNPRRLNATWYTVTRRRGSAVVSKYYAPQPSIRKQIEASKTELFQGQHPMLGIHMRGTDKLRAGGRKIVSPKDYVPHILSFRAKYPKGGIFVATDDANMLRELKLHAPQITFSSQSIDRRADKKSPFVSDTPEQLGFEIMTDIYLLSSCDYLLHTVSSVVESVMYINIGLNERAMNLEYGNESGIPWDK